MCECMHVSGDGEFHGKLSSLNDGKHANFDMTINVFSLTVCSPIFGCMLPSVCLELWLAGRAKSVGVCASTRERERERERENFHEREIYRFPSHMTGSNNEIHFSIAQVPLGFQTVLFLTIHFSISCLFALSLNIKEFYLTL